MENFTVLKSIFVLLCIFAIDIFGSHLVEKPSYDLDTSRELFDEFTKTYNKTYSSQVEYEKRHQFFRDNLIRINELNKNIERGLYMINHFTDLSREEFKKMYTGFKIIKDLRTSPGFKFDLDHFPKQVPKSFDWRDLGVVTPVKDQLSCGSCWAFSAIANIESQYAIKTRSLISFSEQQLLDCDNRDSACDGGIMGQAFQFLKDSGGVMAESDYPYTAKKGKCAFVENEVKVKIVGVKESGSIDEEELKKLLYTNGPLSIAVNAETMMHYHGGIDHPTIGQCNPEDLNHGVTLVGFGEENGMNYWVIKNSWASTWGEKGYYRLQRGTGACGVNMHIASAVIS